METSAPRMSFAAILALAALTMAVPPLSAQEFGDFRRKDPTPADLLYRQMKQTEDRKEQIVLLEKAVALDPKHRGSNKMLGLLLVQEGRVVEAFTRYKTYLEGSGYGGRPEGFTHLFVAGHFEDAGRHDLAAEIYRLVLKMSAHTGRFEQCYLFSPPRFEPSRYAGLEEYKDLLLEIERLQPNCTNDEHRNNAVRLMNQGKLDQALAELQLQIQVNPHFMGTYSILEDLHRQRNEPEKALDAVKQYFALEKDPTLRCRRYQDLRKSMYKRVDKQFIEQLQQECELKKK